MSLRFSCPGLNSFFFVYTNCVVQYKFFSNNIIFLSLNSINFRSLETFFYLELFIISVVYCSQQSAKKISSDVSFKLFVRILHVWDTSIRFFSVRSFNFSFLQSQYKFVIIFIIFYENKLKTIKFQIIFSEMIELK